MAEENPTWGYFRIRGELMKHGYTVSATAIRSVLRRAGLPPAGRRARLTWKRFLAAHANTLVAADFFAVDTVFLRRLLFIHMASRRIVWAACNGEPNGEWVNQQARSALWQLAEEATEVRLMLHDRDRKFSRGFDTLWEAEGARVMLTPLMAPKANVTPSAGWVALDESAVRGGRVVSRPRLGGLMHEYSRQFEAA